MKTIQKIFLLSLVFVLALGCKKDEEMAMLDGNAVPVVTLSSSNLVLDKDKADTEVLTVSWEKPNYGFAAAPSYTILIDKKGGDFTKAVNVVTGTELKKVFKASELNAILLGFGFLPGTVNDLDIKVQSSLGASTVLSSTMNTLKATPYSAKLDLSTTWGVVGSAANNWGATPDLPFYKTDAVNVLVAYVTLTDGEIKFRQNNDWTVNLGGSDGTLSSGGNNIAVKAGTYKITFNPVALTYKIEKYAWGIVGSAANNWGATPDLPLSYDPTVDLWTGVVDLIDGEIKIRKDNDWGTNYGGSGGVLKDGGDNIAVKKGTYLITVDFKKLTYTITKYAPWGIVGAATATGWGDKPDQKFTYDLSTETWVLKGVVLKADQFKFRLNDDWGTNYGTTAAAAQAIGTSGALKLGGENFIATAGTYDFELNLKDAANPTYKATKVK
ncbi:SusE domain-containing protein [Arcicella sp. DC2W]|uniref:SusE domain-containing protein n=1 Tax=Arcicella gelida TaxID=2984195 RepID=A0ABU5SB41_9BACT|nr:SusE domain-containing protein [Arcicella sp. DC2W]MEA5405711.1 SusE domain-containing protein [Arcicella sp. DC2W]